MFSCEFVTVLAPPVHSLEVLEQQPKSGLEALNGVSNDRGLGGVHGGAEKAEISPKTSTSLR
jgi:hypothetical protein